MSTSDSRGRRVGLVAAIISLLAAVAFPFAPVEREDVTYRVDTGAGSGSAVAIPLLPYQPLRLDAVIACGVAAAHTGDVLTTVPPVTDPDAERLAGLRVSSGGGAVTVESGGATLGPVAPPPGCGALEVTSTAEATVLSVREAGGTRELARVDGDVRPAVAGAFVGPAPEAGGIALEVVGDTRFQTSPTWIKIALGLVALAGLGVALGSVGRGERRARPPGAPRPARPRLTDVGVIGTLGLWQVIGPLSVDDGYIGGIVRERFANGQVGTVFRWLNSPEAPFGWFYDVLAGLAVLAPDPFWLRLPSTLLGVVAWLLLSRAVLPRLRVPSTRWWRLGAGVVFLAWWLPFGLGVRPEPWVVVGWTVVLVLVERALARRVLLPALLGLVVAGATLAVTPTGLVAFTPFLVALAPLARMLRARRPEVGTPLLVLAPAAALGVTLLFAFADQGLAAVLDSVGIRRLIGGDSPWSDEAVRYATLLTEGDPEGNLGRRAPVLAMLLALLVPVLVGPGWTGRLRGLARGPVRRVAASTVIGLGLLALTPTKWTHHFGAFAVVGTAVTLVALHVWRTASGEPRVGALHARRAAVGTVVAAVVAGLVWAGHNQWHWISGFAVGWSEVAPQVAGLRLADVVLTLGVVLGGALAAVALGRHLRGGRDEGPAPRMLAVPPALVLGTVALVVAVEVLTLGRTAVARRDSYTLASDSIASLTGTSCGLADRLRVEPDPAGGLLAPVTPGDAPPPPPPGTAPVTAFGVTLPGWWGPGVVGGASALPAPGSDEGLPLVITVGGPVVATGDLVLETVDDVTGATSRIELDEFSSQYSASATIHAPGPRDLRVDRGLLPERGSVRVISRADGPAQRFFSVPRLPRTVPFSDLLPPGTPAAVDWPGAFLFPCTPLAPLRDGAAPLPGWRVSIDARGREESGFISYTASEGGPWTTSRLLVREQDVPVYLPGLPLTDVATLARWIPVVPLGPGPQVRRETRVEPGWASPGPLTVGRG